MSKTQILSPVGRMVQGNPFEGNTTDAAGKPLTDRNGNPRTNYFVALAVPKDSPDWPAFKQQLDAVGAAAFPNQYHLPTFSSKIIDGDDVTPDQNGNRPVDKPGFAGCWVVRFSSGFAPQVVTKGGAAQISDPNAIKRGDYIRVAGTADGNGNAQKPGIYVNLSMVEFIGHGVEIVTGPDAAQVFGSQPAPYIPPGVSQTPTAPATPPAVGVTPPVPVTPAPQPAPPVAAAPAPQPPAGVTPAPDFLDGGKVTLPDGQVFTRQSLLDAGWTPQQVDALPKAQ